MHSKFAALTLLALLTAALAGCNTIAGAGKDIERAGSAISNAASK
jgi:predicted small secreted protein